MGTAVTLIRSMLAADVVAVAALEANQQPRPWTEQTFRDELAVQNRIYLVAEVRDAVVGFGGVMVIGDEAHVTNLLVDEAQRRHGLGRELMVSLIELAIERGACQLTLEVRSGNDAARALYAGLGLVPVGLRPRYYRDDDALIMWAHDIDKPGYLESLR